MLAEELVVIDPDAALWQAVRPLLTIALNIEQRENYVWHGWSKQQITHFLAQLPGHCTLIVGVWSTNVDERVHEMLQLGFACEVYEGQVSTIRTFESLVGAENRELLPVQELEPGAEHALMILRQVHRTIAPVAWALFTDKETWDEWIYGDDDAQRDAVADKGALLLAFARQGRCVLMGSQARYHE